MPPFHPKLYVGVTDKAWFEHLTALGPDEVNFWQPGGNQQFQALQEGELFLFKLHSPLNFIVGGGYFASSALLPISLVWNWLGETNGVPSFDEFHARIRHYRKTKHAADAIDPVIGCIVLSEPFFWPESKWIPVGEYWSKNIVQGKTLRTDEPAGAALLAQVQERLAPILQLATQDQLPPSERYGAASLVRRRLGQGSFRVLVTESYQHRCAITGERTLPILEAAHIKPYKQNGPHRIDNGLLLRRDFHSLFDLGYLTVTPELRVEVSGRLAKEWKNGKEYYARHGERLLITPKDQGRLPSREFLEWHNEAVFRA